MKTVLILLFALICFLLVLVILLQPGRGSGMGAIGGGGSQTMFGARGAVGFLGKMTGWLAASFMVLALVLARMSISSSSVVADQQPAQQESGASGDEGGTSGDEGAGDEGGGGESSEGADEGGGDEGGGTEGAASESDEAAGSEGEGGDGKE